MRKFIFQILFLTLAMTIGTPAMAQEALFDKYEDANGVTTIYISKTMLGMISNVKAGKHDIEKIANRLDHLRILSCEKAALVPTLLEEAKKQYQTGGYEAVMKMNDDGEKVTIYQRTLKNGKNEFALLTEEKNEINIINIVGSITLKDIKDITAGH